MALLASPVSGPTETLGSVRIPRTASNRQAITWAKLLERVDRDRVWGGWLLDGQVVRPGGWITPDQMGKCCLLLECAGANRRGEYVYVLWGLDWKTMEFHEIARAASKNADWTLDLGPIARRALHPPQPFVLDPDAAAAHVVAALDHELEDLDRRAQRVVMLRVWDRMQARMAAG